MTYDPVVVDYQGLIPVKPAELKELVAGGHNLLREQGELELPTSHEPLEGHVEGLL